MEFESFDEDYVQKLVAGDPDVESHFASYFTKLVRIKTNYRRLPPEDSDDVLQETLLRVIRRLREGGGLAQAAGLGAFVNAVCNNVMREKIRQHVRHPTHPNPGRLPEPADSRVPVNGNIERRELKALVEEVLGALPDRDQKILRMLFLEERTKPEICKDLGVEADYLRVVLHRAKSRFRQKLAERTRKVTPV
jgi:RNA polymerase sigma-70 factor (ECF subfamily)